MCHLLSAEDEEELRRDFLHSQRFQVMQWEKQSAQGELWAPIEWQRERIERATVAADSAGATWPPNDGWHFRPGEFAFNGVVGRAVRKTLDLIEMLTTSRAPVSRQEILSKLYMDNAGMVQDAAVDQLVKRARVSIRKAFGLPVSAEPIPHVDSGHRKAWRIDETILHKI